MSAAKRRDWDGDDAYGVDDRYARADWEDDRPRRRRRGPIGRVVSLVKLALFLAPLALFLFGSVFADCRARPSFSDWTSVLGASACARSEMIGNVSSMQENFAFLKRLIN